MREKRVIFYDTEYYDHLYLKTHFYNKMWKDRATNITFYLIFLLK